MVTLIYCGTNMNERIRELALQADLIRVLNEHAHEYGNGQFDNTLYPELEKFAELIVREAMTVTKDYTCNQGLDYSAPVALARHFGVKS
jgi:hypothetical protein